MTSGPETRAAPIEPKVDAESLRLRASPRRVVRFRRGLLIGVAASAAAVLSSAAWMALSPRGAVAKRPPDDLAASDGQRPAEAVTQLPSDYGKAASPVLGPPLPGDLGRAVVELRNGKPGADSAQAGGPVQSPPTAQANDAAHQARTSGVFAQVRGSTSSVFAPWSPPPPAEAAATVSPPTDRRSAWMAAPNTAASRNKHPLVAPPSPNMILAGDVISASLLTGLNSDLPGAVTAQVTANVYDTVTGQILLIPQGSRLIGAYDNTIGFGQDRALVVWRRLILPDGWSVELDNFSATDAAGFAGLTDQVDFHSGRLLKGAAMSTLVGVGAELSLGDEDSELVRALQRAAQQTASQTGQQIVAKHLDVQPTLKVRPGWPLRVIVHVDLELRPWRG